MIRLEQRLEGVEPIYFLLACPKKKLEGSGKHFFQIYAKTTDSGFYEGFVLCPNEVCFILMFAHDHGFVNMVKKYQVYR